MFGVEVIEEYYYRNCNNHKFEAIEDRQKKRLEMIMMTRRKQKIKSAEVGVRERKKVEDGNITKRYFGEEVIQER